jgi:hypothetical protein
VNFNGTGTVAILAAVNVSSITDTGTGDYTVNFTTAMPDKNYAISGVAVGESNTGSGVVVLFVAASADILTSSVRIRTSNENGNAVDIAYVSSIVFR